MFMNIDDVNICCCAMQCLSGIRSEGHYPKSGSLSESLTNTTSHSSTDITQQQQPTTNKWRVSQTSTMVKDRKKHTSKEDGGYPTTPIKRSKHSPTTPDTDTTAPLPPIMQATLASDIRKYLSKPTQGGPSLYMQLLTLEENTRKNITKLEEEVRRLRADLQNEMVTASNPRRKKSHENFDQFVCRVTKRCEDRISYIQKEIQEIKKGIDHDNEGGNGKYLFYCCTRSCHIANNTFP